MRGEDQKRLLGRFLPAITLDTRTSSQDGEVTCSNFHQLEKKPMLNASISSRATIT